MKSETINFSGHLTSSSVAALGHSSEHDGSRLSPHFTLRELCKTSVRMENVPGVAQVENLKRLCRWLERLRRRWNDLYADDGGVGMEEPLIVNSGYRSAAVNKAVGGAPTSNHLTGCAVDIRVAGLEVGGGLRRAAAGEEGCGDVAALRRAALGKQTPRKAYRLKVSWFLL